MVLPLGLVPPAPLLAPAPPLPVLAAIGAAPPPEPDVTDIESSSPPPPSFEVQAATKHVAVAIKKAAVRRLESFMDTSLSPFARCDAAAARAVASGRLPSRAAPRDADRILQRAACRTASRSVLAGRKAERPARLGC